MFSGKFEKSKDNSKTKIKTKVKRSSLCRNKKQKRLTVML